MKLSKVLCASALLLLTSCGAPDTSTLEEAWNPINDPLQLGAGWHRQLSTLPTSGVLNKKPWTDTYWPNSQGGLAYRWQVPNAHAWTYATPSRELVARMSPANLAVLSPAEKFDILNGNFHYPTVAFERQRTSPQHPRWFGLCHGWAAAAINFEEPKPITMRSAAGISVPFGSSDIKALLSYYQGNISGAPSRTLGGRCNGSFVPNPSVMNLPECRDANAGAFHIILTNMIALRNTSFIADVSRDIEVWNHPIYGFRSRIVQTRAPSPGSAPGTTMEAIIETQMAYIIEVGPMWAPQLGSAVDRSSEATVTYTYAVELNRAGEIIGGEWLTVHRPDFLWIQAKPQFANQWGNLGRVYDASLGLATPDIPVGPTPAPAGPVAQPPEPSGPVVRPSPGFPTSGGSVVRPGPGYPTPGTPVVRPVPGYPTPSDPMVWPAPAHPVIVRPTPGYPIPRGPVWPAPHGPILGPIPGYPIPSGPIVQPALSGPAMRPAPGYPALPGGPVVWHRI